jgi:hypothetical protein
VEATDYNAVAPGTMMDLKLRFKSHDCHLSVGASSNVSLAVENQPALFVKTYLPEYDKVKKAENSGSSIADEIKLPVSFTLEGTLAPGKYSIPAVLTYQAMDKSGNLVQQSTQVAIPVTVVASKAQVRPIQKPDRWADLKMAGMILAAIPAAPVVVVIGIIDVFTGRPILMED